MTATGRTLRTRGGGRRRCGQGTRRRRTAPRAVTSWIVTYATSGAVTGKQLELFPRHSGRTGSGTFTSTMTLPMTMRGGPERTVTEQWQIHLIRNHSG